MAQHGRDPLAEAIHYKRPLDAIDAAAEHARRLNRPVTIYTHKDGMHKGVAIGARGPTSRGSAFSHPGKEWRAFARIGSTGKVMSFKPDMTSPITKADIERQTKRVTTGLKLGREWLRKDKDVTPRRAELDRRIQSVKDAMRNSPRAPQVPPTIQAMGKVGLLGRVITAVKAAKRRLIGEWATGPRVGGPTYSSRSLHHTLAGLSSYGTRVNYGPTDVYRGLTRIFGPRGKFGETSWAATRLKYSGTPLPSDRGAPSYKHGHR